MPGPQFGVSPLTASTDSDRRWPRKPSRPHDCLAVAPFSGLWTGGEADQLRRLCRGDCARYASGCQRAGVLGDRQRTPSASQWSNVTWPSRVSSPGSSTSPAMEMSNATRHVGTSRHLLPTRVEHAAGHVDEVLRLRAGDLDVPSEWLPLSASWIYPDAKHQLTRRAVPDAKHQLIRRAAPDATPSRRFVT